MTSEIVFQLSNYEVLASELNIHQKSEFSTILEYFVLDDKINIKNGNIQFCHPSYSEAISYIIHENISMYRRKNTRAEEILEKVLLKLSAYNYYDYNLAIIRIIIDNFHVISSKVLAKVDKMPRTFQNQLLNFIESGRIKVDQQRKQYDFLIKGAKIFGTCNEINRLSNP